MSGKLDDLSPSQTAALAEYKKKVHESVFPQLKESPPVIYGVRLDGLASEATPKAQLVILLKFLRAREFNQNAALEMIKNTLKWREENNINTILDEQFGEEYTSLGFLYKHDKHGNPVTYNFYGNMNHDVLFNQPNGIDRFVRWRIQLMEKAIALLDFENGKETVLQVHDYAKVSFFSLDPNVKQASKMIIELFQNHYPEFLERKFFLNVPRFLEFLFVLMSSLSTSRTRNKFAMIAKGNVRQALLDHIDRENLPAVYGGFEPSEDLSAAPTQKLTVSSGKRVIHRERASAGQAFRYNFLTAKDDIGFLAVLSPSAKPIKETEFEYARQESGKGVFTATEDGEVLFVFDNTFSYFTSKEVYFSVQQQ